MFVVGEANCDEISVCEVLALTHINYQSGAQVKALRKSSQEEKIRKSFLRSVSTMNLESFATSKLASNSS